MSLGNELRKLAGVGVSTEDIFSSIETVIQDLAKEKEKGCKIRFSIDINDEQISEIYDKLDKEEISVDKKAGVIYWNKSVITNKIIPRPCKSCPTDMRISCCGCIKYEMWEKKKETAISYNVRSTLKIGVTQDGRVICNVEKYHIISS